MTQPPGPHGHPNDSGQPDRHGGVAAHGAATAGRTTGSRPPRPSRRTVAQPRPTPGSVTLIRRPRTVLTRRSWPILEVPPRPVTNQRRSTPRRPVRRTMPRQARTRVQPPKPLSPARRPRPRQAHHRPQPPPAARRTRPRRTSHQAQLPTPTPVASRPVSRRAASRRRRHRAPTREVSARGPRTRPC